MVNVIIHKSVGVECTQNEYESENTHIYTSGTSLPANPDGGDLFLKYDENNIYFYNGTNWERWVLK